MQEYKQLGSYGLIRKDKKILLIKKVIGPYDGKLDLPGGTIEFGETPKEALKREFKEETGLEISEYKLFDTDSVCFNWQYKEDLTLKVHHIGIFYEITDYKGKIKNNILIDEENDDSLGFSFYDIDKLNKNDLSKIAILELGYKL